MISIVGDDVVESTESFTVSLTTGDSAVNLNPQTTTVTIQNDDSKFGKKGKFSMDATKLRVCYLNACMYQLISFHLCKDVMCLQGFLVSFETILIKQVTNLDASYMSYLCAVILVYM